MFKMVNKRLRNRKGFTLIELIVVIAILGILAAIAVPRLGGFQDNAKKASDEALAATVARSVEMHNAANNTTLAAGLLSAYDTELGEMIDTTETFESTTYGDGTVPYIDYDDGDVIITVSDGGAQVYPQP